jgi:MFS family permease
VQGLGAAIMMSLTMAFVGDTVPKERTGSAMGLLGTMSAAGTALGPSLGGVLIAGLGWRAIFLINLPLGLVALLLAWRSLPMDRELTLAEARAASPRFRLAMLRERGLSGGLAMNILVTSVVMATLVVGPFYLSAALALDAARVGLVMTCGPIVAALTGVPAGRIVDRFGPFRMTVAGLLGMAAGSVVLAAIPAGFGVPGYLAPLVVITGGYALFQAANNTAVMTGVRNDQRGVVSGMLNLSRNLGLIAGTSLMGAVFAFGAGTASITTAQPEAVGAGMRLTFAAAAVLVIAALAIARTRGRE